MARFRIRYRVFAKHDGVNCGVKDYCDVEARDDREATKKAQAIASAKYNRLEKPLPNKGDEYFEVTEIGKEDRK